MCRETKQSVIVVLICIGWIVTGIFSTAYTLHKKHDIKTTDIPMIGATGIALGPLALTFLLLDLIPKGVVLKKAE